MVFSSWSKHLRRLGSGAEPSRNRSVPAVCVLHCDRVSLLHQLRLSIVILCSAVEKMRRHMPLIGIGAMNLNNNIGLY